MDKLIEFCLDEILEGDPLGLLNEPKARTKTLNADDKYLPKSNFAYNDS